MCRSVSCQDASSCKETCIELKPWPQHTSVLVTTSWHLPLRVLCLHFPCGLSLFWGALGPCCWLCERASVLCVAAGASVSISRPGVTLHTTVFACQPLSWLLHVCWAHVGGCLSCRAMLLPTQL
jgi:hypothetical protein